jgi:glycosyltransferase involved in cell wall biosynthesis
MHGKFPMKILFLDQSGALGGAELCLLDILSELSSPYVVGLLQDGPFRQRLEANQIPVQVLSRKPIQTRKESGFLQGMAGFVQLLPMIRRTTQLAQDCDLLYANTPKALILGASVSLLRGLPLVYHLHDIISADHFSATNRKLLILLANRFSQRVIANSEASKAAFMAAGGDGAKVSVVYNGFRPGDYAVEAGVRDRIRQQLELTDNHFVVGQFSRLSPWKGQHILIEALTQCPENVCALLIGEALFGEDAYVQELYGKVERLQLQHRVKFLGFRTNVPQMMAACDLVAHTSTAPEPFGRVVVEAMLCRRPVVAAAAGGAVELISSHETGWLTPPGDVPALATIINTCREQPETAESIAQRGEQQARQRFNLTHTNEQIYRLLNLSLDEDRIWAQG